jgi:hypothetical protein
VICILKCWFYFLKNLSSIPFVKRLFCHIQVNNFAALARIAIWPGIRHLQGKWTSGLYLSWGVNFFDQNRNHTTWIFPSYIPCPSSYCCTYLDKPLLPPDVWFISWDSNLEGYFSVSEVVQNWAVWVTCVNQVFRVSVAVSDGYDIWWCFAFAGWMQVYEVRKLCRRIPAKIQHSRAFIGMLESTDSV